MITKLQKGIQDYAESNVKTILGLIGEDIEREGLKDTPRRYINFLNEFLKPEDFEFTTFEKDNDEMIVVSNIPFFSLCEHHLVPFFGHAAIGYIPTQKQAGLSKLPRLLDKYARRLQNQERITREVAEELNTVLQPKGVAVILKARHLCMEMRGIKKHDTYTTTSKMIGVFKDDLNCRQEFLNLIK
jgi:GTP cyclohydrolase IA